MTTLRESDLTAAPTVDAPLDGVTVTPTVLPRRDALPASQQPRRRTGGVSRDSVLNGLGAIAVGLCVGVLLFGRLAPFSGLIGSVVVVYVTSVLTYGVLISLKEDWQAIKDRIASVLLASAAGLLILTLADVVLFTFFRGSKAIFHLNFYTQDLSRAGPLQGLKIGGVKHAIIGTFWMVGIALAISIPIGFLTAVFLHEARSRLGRLVRTVVEAMTAMPSILAGLFVLAVFEIQFHRGPSGLAAALALSIMMIPVIIRTAEVVLRLVPGNLKEASHALGAPAWRTMVHIILPTARAGLTTSVILGTAREIGETSPVLVTASYTFFTNTNPLKGPMVSLPLVAYKLVSSPEKTQIQRGFGAASLLLLLVFLIFSLARLVGGRGPGQLSRRQAERALRQSQRDLSRIEPTTSTPLTPPVVLTRSRWRFRSTDRHPLGDANAPT